MKKLKSLSLREIVLVVAAGLFAVGFLIDFMLISPQKEHKEALTKKLDTLNAQILQINKQLSIQLKTSPENAKISKLLSKLDQFKGKSQTDVLRAILTPVLTKNRLVMDTLKFSPITQSAHTGFKQVHVRTVISGRYAGLSEFVFHIKGLPVLSRFTRLNLTRKSKKSSRLIMEAKFTLFFL